MKQFAYEKAADERAAVAAVAARASAAFLAGGTNLVDHMKLGVARPDLLVDVGGLPLDYVREGDDGSLRIGAAVRNSDLAAHPIVRERYPVLSRALLSGASGQLRNLATTGGNLLQRTRCVYFQDVTTPCNKREPGSGCAARGGYTRYHAILGASEACVAVHPSDMAVALTALDAQVRVRDTTGERTIPITELYRLPRDEPQRDTVLAHGDLITEVVLPPLRFASCSTYRKVRDRASYAFALVSVAAALDLHDGIVRDARIVLGGVAHRPWRAYRAEAGLRGKPATADLFAAACDAELDAAEPLPDNAFKVPLAIRTMIAVLRELAGLS